MEETHVEVGREVGEEEEGGFGGRQAARWPMQKRIVVAVALLLLLALLAVAGLALYRLLIQGPVDDRPNVIFMISDGFGPAAATFARTMRANQTALELDEMLVGTARTYSSSSLITDSAAGATAYSCAMKTYNGAIAVDDQLQACATAMEAAKQQGYRTGFVVKSRVTHATPAAWSAHVPDREMEEAIAFQQAFNQSLDLFMGGGLDKFTQREDGLDLLDQLTARGYRTLLAKEELSLPDIGLPVVGLFARSHMMFEVDRVNQQDETQPTLAEMVQSALALLGGADDSGPPFFLMIEGSMIDLAGHNHDAYAEYLEIVSYDEAVKVVKDYVAERPNTVVISTSDHSTGGLTLGRGYGNGTYPEPYLWRPEILYQQTASAEFIAGQLYPNLTNANATILQYTGLVIDDEDYLRLEGGMANPDSRFLKIAVGDIVAKAALIGWTTPGHTGVDVNLYSWGIRPESLTGSVMNNIDVGQAVIDELGLGQTIADLTSAMADAYLVPGLPPPQANQYAARHS